MYRYQMMSRRQKDAALGTEIAYKRPLRYRVVDAAKAMQDGGAKDRLLSSLLACGDSAGRPKGGIYDDALFPRLSIMVNLGDLLNHPPGACFGTWLGPRRRDLEEAGVPFEAGNVLVKGPLGEIYRVKSLEKLEEKYSRVGRHYVPIARPVRVVRMTAGRFRSLKASGVFEKGAHPGTLRMETSYGGTHEFRAGDVLVVEGDEFYRVQRAAFEATYTTSTQTAI